jgi:hypothetical protein
VTKYDRSNDFQGAEFVDVNMSGALFREVDLSDARMRGVLLVGADIDGAIDGLRLNGVEVAPLVEAELDRLHPERTKLRPTSPAGAREAWATVEAIWAGTMERAAKLSEQDLRRSVGDEWSFLDTLRHLVFVTDAWFGNSVVLHPQPFHPLGLPASFMADGHAFGIDVTASPTLEEILRVRVERMEMVRTYLDSATQTDLDASRKPGVPGWPPPAPRCAIDCLRVIFNEEWTHHQFAIRDLGVIETEAAQAGVNE